MANTTAGSTLINMLDRYQRVDGAHEHHRVLQDSLKAIHLSLGSPAKSSRILANAVLAAHNAAEQLGVFLEHCYDDIPVSMRPSQQSAAVFSKILGIPELLERILLELDTPNLVIANQVNKAMRLEVERSHTLQRKLYLRPDPAAFFAPLAKELMRPFSASRSFRCSRVERARHQLTMMRTTPEIVVRRSPMNSAMLVCQPPVLEMQAEIGCRCMSDSNPDARPTDWSELNVIRSDTGITLQQLDDATGRIRLWHQHCPMATVNSHNLDGSVRTAVHFTADLKLLQDDDVLQKPQREKVSRIKHLEERQEKLGGYIETKRAAHNAGLSIPTFAEFQVNSIAPVEGQGSS